MAANGLQRLWIFNNHVFNYFWRRIIGKYKKSGYWVSNCGGLSWVWGKEMIHRLQKRDADLKCFSIIANETTDDKGQSEFLWREFWCPQEPYVPVSVCFQLWILPSCFSRHGIIMRTLLGFSFLSTPDLCWLSLGIRVWMLTWRFYCQWQLFFL